jgi:tetratricopeptide (TPR) repeat protein
MKIPINSPARKWLIAAGALLFAAVYLGLAAREFVASVLGKRTELMSLKAATWLDPANADYRNHLGRYYDLVARDPLTAIAQYKKAVELDPHSAALWFDLAGAYQVLDDTAHQTVALARAIQAEPTKPDVAWTAANFYLVQGENDKALNEFRVVMANDPSLAASAIGLCWRVNPDVDALLRDVVPPTSSAYIAFLALLQRDADTIQHDLSSPPDPNSDPDPAARLLATQAKVAQMKSETAATFKVWDALVQSHQPFEQRSAFEYMQFLLRHQEVDQAILVWKQTAERFGLSSYLTSPLTSSDPANSNLVVNGDFSLDVLETGFDWQYQKQPGVKLTLEPLATTKTDDEPSASGFLSRLHDFFSQRLRPAPVAPPQLRGPRSLMLTLDGPGISDAGFYQFVPVQPNTTYEFSAQYRNDKEPQGGAGGPRLTITDMYTLADYFQSEELKESHKPEDQDNDLKIEDKWKPVQGHFTTGPDCKLVVLHIRRLPVNSPIRGKLWIENLRIVRTPS